MPFQSLVTTIINKQHIELTNLALSWKVLTASGECIKSSTASNLLLILLMSVSGVHIHFLKSLLPNAVEVLSR
jgi:hypothetical protein